MFKNLEYEQERLLAFLGLSLNVNLTSHLKKINPDKVEDILINYGEVKKCLGHSQFAYCLE
jgi:hypothetical protein